MHVAVEAVGNTRGGGWVILNEILASLCRDSRFAKITVLGAPQSAIAEPRYRHPKIRWEVRSFESVSYIARLFWYEEGLQKRAAEIHADVVLLLNGVGNVKGKHVNYIQQTLFFDPDARKMLPVFHRLRVEAMAKLARRSCERSDNVFVQTQTMKLKMEKNWMIHPKIVYSPPPEIRVQEQALTSKSVLWVGSELPYKRRDFFRRAMTHLPDDIDIQEISSLDAGLSRNALLEITKKNTLMAMTSLSESLGLPMLEAMSQHTALVVPRLPYAMDICQDAALYYDPLSLSDFVTKVTDILNDLSLRNEYVQRGTRRALELSEVSSDYKELRDALCM